VLLVILANGIFQVIGVSSIFPFFALAADPGRVQRSELGRRVLAHLPAMTQQEMLVMAGILAIVALVLTNAVALISEVMRIRYAYGLGFWLRSRILDRLGSQSYEYFLERNSAAIIQRLVGDVGMFVSAVLLPLLDILTRGLTFLLLVATVILVQREIAVVATVALVFFYVAVFVFLRPRAHAVSYGLWEHNRGQMVAAQQFLTGIKPILIHGRAGYFAQQFRAHASEVSRLEPRVPIYGNTPRYLVEPLAFGGLAGIVVVMAWRGQPSSGVLPNLAVITLAAYKLLPTAQTLYTQISSVTSMGYTLGEVESELAQAAASPDENSAPEDKPESSSAALEFNSSLRLESVHFAYPRTKAPALDSVSFSVQKNESVGIVGVTGSGKSTLVDLILGLHVPKKGTVYVDDRPLTPDVLPQWRSMIGYVPQDIFLLDDTITANIAFGIAAEDVDPERVRAAARAAQILTFIDEHLPLGFNTLVGERGVRLSGGQRQRIGLARAFYGRPEVLVLDEATSSLDHQTEESIMETIHELHGKLTIIMIAHRMSTLARCDRILRIEGGEIVEELSSALAQ
jgi:ABC-type multidrug transport system fused ATPase/permease subunit